MFDGDEIVFVTCGEQLACHTACWVDKGDSDLAAGTFHTWNGIVAVFVDVAVLVDSDSVDNHP